MSLPHVYVCVFVCVEEGRKEIECGGGGGGQGLKTCYLHFPHNQNTFRPKKYIHTYTHTYVHTGTYTYIHTYIHVYIYQYVCMYVLERSKELSGILSTFKSENKQCEEGTLPSPPSLSVYFYSVFFHLFFSFSLSLSLFFSLGLYVKPLHARCLN